MHQYVWVDYKCDALRRSRPFQPMKNLRMQWSHAFNVVCEVALVPSPHLLVLATNERCLPTRGIFEAILASESHWLQPVLVLSVHWWPSPVGVGWVLEKAGGFKKREKELDNVNF
jgi:hypothetical protein